MIIELKIKKLEFFAVKHLEQGGLQIFPLSPPFPKVLILFAVGMSMNSEPKQIHIYNNLNPLYILNYILRGCPDKSEIRKKYKYRRNANSLQ